MPRVSERSRSTSETTISLRLDLDGSGQSTIATGLGLFDHMLNSFARHARFDIDLKCIGDLHVDDHHTIEDCALVLGAALDEALADRSGIARFGSAYAPLDEALSRSVVDLSGRPGAWISLGLLRESIGDVACENITHFFHSLATSSRCSLHIDVLRGVNDHHRAESAFKSCALSLRAAVALDPSAGIPSTKGTLT